MPTTLRRQPSRSYHFMKVGGDAMARNWEGRKCVVCGKGRLYTTRREYRHPMRYEGREFEIVVPDLEVLACDNPACDDLLTDDAAAERIGREGYRQLGLLLPEEIRANRRKLRLRQQELAKLLGLGGNSLSRWEKGRYYQSRVIDNLLRLVFHLPEARETLAEIARDPSIGRSVRGRSRKDGAGLGGDAGLPSHEMAGVNV